MSHNIYKIPFKEVSGMHDELKDSFILVWENHTSGGTTICDARGKELFYIPKDGRPNILAAIATYQTQDSSDLEPYRRGVTQQEVTLVQNCHYIKDLNELSERIVNLIFDLTLESITVKKEVKDQLSDLVLAILKTI